LKTDKDKVKVFMERTSMVNGQTGNSQREPTKLPQHLAVVMAIFAFILFGGGWLLNQKLETDEANLKASLAPVEGQKIWITGQEQFRFEWSGKTEENTFIEVARDPEFGDLVLNEATIKSPFLTDKIPGEGDYFYRLITRTGDDNLVALKPVRFTVITRTPPQLIYPFGAMTSQEGKTLRFYWQSKHGVSKYHFQLSFDRSFEHLLSDFVVSETQSSPQNLPVGDFFWRVRGENDANNFSQWTDLRHLRIEKGDSLAATKIPDVPPVQPFEELGKTEAVKSDPVRTVEKTVEKPVEKPIEKKSVAAAKTKVTKPQVAKTTRSMDSDPKPTTKPPKPVAKKVVTKEVVAKEVVAKKEKPKKAPVAIEVVSAPIAKERKPASVPKNILAMPRPKLPPDGVSLVSLNGTQDPILFKWEAVEGAEKYRLEIAADAGFKNFIHSTVIRENQVVVTQLLPKGHIYWRVRAEQGTNKSSWSSSFSIDK